MATKIVKNAGGGLGSTTTLYTLGCRASGRCFFDHGCSTVPTGAPLAILAQLKHIRVLQKTDQPLLIAMIADSKDCLDCVDGCLDNQCNNTLLGVLQKIAFYVWEPLSRKAECRRPRCRAAYESQMHSHSWGLRIQAANY